MTFEFDDNVQISKDERGNVQVLDHLQQPFVAGAASESDGLNGFVSPTPPVSLADQYLKQVASAYGTGQNMLSDTANNNRFSSDSASPGTFSQSERGQCLYRHGAEGTGFRRHRAARPHYETR